MRHEKGERELQTEYFYGYKAHVSLNAEIALITGLEVMSGGAYDGHRFVSLVEQDLQQGLPLETCVCDNHFCLERQGLH